MRRLIEELEQLTEGQNIRSWAGDFVKAMNKKFRDGSFRLQSMGGGKISVSYNKPDLRRTKLMKKFIQSEFGLSDFDVAHTMFNDGGESVYTLEIGIPALKKKVLGEAREPNENLIRQNIRKAMSSVNMARKQYDIALKGLTEMSVWMKMQDPEYAKELEDKAFILKNHLSDFYGLEEVLGTLKLGKGRW